MLCTNDSKSIGSSSIAEEMSEQTLQLESDLNSSLHCALNKMILKALVLSAAHLDMG